jgi:DNA mismatch repair protein MLH3
MFNDNLSKEQCQELVLRLADCVFPFQCAHGRPSMVPLVDLGCWTDFGSPLAEEK